MWLNRIMESLEREALPEGTLERDDNDIAARSFASTVETHVESLMVQSPHPGLSSERIPDQDW